MTAPSVTIALTTAFLPERISTVGFDGYRDFPTNSTDSTNSPESFAIAFPGTPSTKTKGGSVYFDPCDWMSILSKTPNSTDVLSL